MSRESVIGVGDLILSRDERDEILEMMDHVDSLARFCSVTMPDVPRYYRGANALWAIVWKIAGDEQKSLACKKELDEWAADPARKSRGAGGLFERTAGDPAIVRPADPAGGLFE